MKDKFQFMLKDKNSKWIFIGLLILGFLTILMNYDKAEKKTVAKEDVFTADTVIPKGFVLVPIEIQNLDSLSSLIGSFGVVDLFTTPQLHQKSGLRVGRRLKLLRAPLNPQQFAVLVPENEAHEILQSSGPFTAVIQNPNEHTPGEVVRKSSSLQVVEYLKGAHHEK